MRVIRPRTAVVEPERKKCLADSANRALNISVTSTSNGSKSAWVSTARILISWLCLLCLMSGCCRRFFHRRRNRVNRYMEFSSCRPLGGRFSHQWFPRSRQRILNFDMGLEAPRPKFCFHSIHLERSEKPLFR